MTPLLPLVPLLPEPILHSPPLNLAKGSTVAVVKRGSAEHPTLYTDQAGEDEYVGAIITDNFGRARGDGETLYVEIGSYTVTAAGQEFEWEAVTGNSVVLDEDGKLPEAQLPDSVVSGSHSPAATPGVTHVINVKDGAFGAKGDGTTNDTAAVEAAIAALPTTGGDIFFPWGLYRIENLLVTKFNVRFVGVGNPGSGISGSFSTNSFSGTAWCAKEPGAWIVTVGLNEGSADFRGQGFENIAFFDSSASHETIEGAMRIRRVNNGNVKNCTFHDIKAGYAIKLEAFSSNPQWWCFDEISTYRVKFGIDDNGSADCSLDNSAILGSQISGTGVVAGSVGLNLGGSAWHVSKTQVQYFEKEIILGAPGETEGHHKVIDVDIESGSVMTEPTAKVGIEVKSSGNVILANVGWAQRYSEKAIRILSTAVGTNVLGFVAPPLSELASIKSYVNDEGVATVMRRTPNYSGIWTPMQAAKFEAIATQPPRETMPVHLAPGTITITSGVMTLGLLPVEPGDLISKLGFVTGSTAATFGSSGYHWWMALYTTAGVLLSQTADQLNAAIAASGSSGLLSLETPYSVPQGIHALYAGLMVNVGTGGSPAAPTLRGNASSAVLGGVGLFTGARNYAATAGAALAATAPAPATLANSGSFPYFGAC